MGNLLAIYKRDLKGYFFSPIAYVVIGLFLLVNGIFSTYCFLVSWNTAMR